MHKYTCERSQNYTPKATGCRTFLLFNMIWWYSLGPCKNDSKLFDLEITQVDKRYYSWKDDSWSLCGIFMWDNLLMFNIYVWFKINMWKIYVEQFLHVSSFHVIYNHCVKDLYGTISTYLISLCDLWSLRESFMWRNLLIFDPFT